MSTRPEGPRFEKEQRKRITENDCAAATAPQTRGVSAFAVLYRMRRAFLREQSRALYRRYGQLLTIACMLFGPTNGIDAEAKAFLAALIRQDAARRLFLFSTHDGELIEATGAQCLRLGAAPP